MKRAEINSKINEELELLEDIRDKLHTVRTTILEAERLKDQRKRILKHKQADIRLNTDFKGLSITNEQGRTAYIEDQTEEEILDLSSQEYRIKELNIEYSNVLDLYTDSRLLIKLETALILGE